MSVLTLALDFSLYDSCLWYKTGYVDVDAGDVGVVWFFFLLWAEVSSLFHLASVA